MAFLLFLILKAQAFTLANTNPHLQGWDVSTLTFDYNPNNCGVNIVSALSDAIAIWNTAETSKLKLAIGSQVSTSVAAAMSGAGNPVVVCDPSFTSNATIGSPNGNLYSGIGMISTQGNRISYGFIVLNSDTGTARISNLSNTALTIAMAHDIGHVLGLGHSADNAALMYYSLTQKQKLNLSQDDIDGITYLYPRDELKGNVLGCGLINKVQPPSPGALVLLLLPLLLALQLSTRSRFKTP